MANLITAKQKKNIKSDYLIRFISVLLLLLSLLGVFLLAYIIPYYIFVVKNDLLVTRQFKPVVNVENKEDIGPSASQIISQTLDQMKAIELYNANFIPSIYFNKIISNKNDDIRLTKLSFNVLTKNQAQFIVSGISRNREGLVAFIEDLKFKAGFTSVESPVSDFANESNISFTLNIKQTI